MSVSLHRLFFNSHRSRRCQLGITSQARCARAAALAVLRVLLTSIFVDSTVLPSLPVNYGSCPNISAIISFYFNSSRKTALGYKPNSLFGRTLISYCYYMYGVAILRTRSATSDLTIGKNSTWSAWYTLHVCQISSSAWRNIQWANICAPILRSWTFVFRFVACNSQHYQSIIRISLRPDRIQWQYSSRRTY